MGTPEQLSHLQNLLTAIGFPGQTATALTGGQEQMVMDQLNALIQSGALIDAGRGPITNFPDVPAMKDPLSGQFSWDFSNENVQKITEIVERVAQTRAVPIPEQAVPPPADQAPPESPSQTPPATETPAPAATETPAPPAASPPRLAFSQTVEKAQAYLYMLGHGAEGDANYAATLDVRGGVDGLRGPQTNAALQAYVSANNIDLGGRTVAQMSDAELADVYTRLENDVKNMPEAAMATRVEAMRAGGVSLSEGKVVQYALNAHGAELAINGTMDEPTNAAYQEHIAGPLAVAAAQEPGDEAPAPDEEPAAFDLESETEAQRTSVFEASGNRIALDDSQNRRLRDQAQEVAERYRAEIETNPELADSSVGALFVRDGTLFYTNADASEVRQINPETFQMNSAFILDQDLREELSTRAQGRVNTHRLGPDEIGETVSFKVGGVEFTAQPIGREVPEGARAAYDLRYGVDLADYKYNTGLNLMTHNGQEMEVRDALQAVDDLRDEYGNNAEILVNSDDRRVGSPDTVQINFREAEDNLKNALREHGINGGGGELTNLFAGMATGQSPEAIQKLADLAAEQAQENNQTRPVANPSVGM